MTTDITAKEYVVSDSALIPEIKRQANAFAEVVKRLPNSRRRAIAMTHIETASMFAVSAACDDDEIGKSEADK